jgi:hypothetical protein
MATIPQVDPKRREQIIEEAASKMASILEDHFDEQGWDEEERARRVTEASVRLATAAAHPAKSS